MRLEVASLAAELGPVRRVEMPETHRGRRVGYRFTCGLGHLHPSYRHAGKCRERYHAKLKKLEEKTR